MVVTARSQRRDRTCPTDISTGSLRLSDAWRFRLRGNDGFYTTDTWRPAPFHPPVCWIGSRVGRGLVFWWIVRSRHVKTAQLWPTLMNWAGCKLWKCQIVWSRLHNFDEFSRLQTMEMHLITIFYSGASAVDLCFRVFRVVWPIRKLL